MTRTDVQRWVRQLRSPRETDILGKAIGQSLVGGEILALIGELGVGKTSLVRGIAGGAGVPQDSVISPTFTLIQEYHGRVFLVHVDMYRIESEKEIVEIGLQDYFNGQASVAIEWADRAFTLLPPDHLSIHLNYSGRRSRVASLQATGPQSADLLIKIMRHADS